MFKCLQKIEIHFGGMTINRKGQRLRRGQSYNTQNNVKLRNELFSVIIQHCKIPEKNLKVSSNHWVNDEIQWFLDEIFLLNSILIQQIRCHIPIMHAFYSLRCTWEAATLAWSTTFDVNNCKCFKNVPECGNWTCNLRPSSHLHLKYWN